MLKQDLQVSTNDLLLVLRAFKRVVNRQFSKIQYRIANQKITRPTKAVPRLYQLLSRRVSVRAITLTREVYDRYLPEGAEGKQPIPPNCDCNSKNTSGIPCIHIQRRYGDDHKQLEPDLFHQHWHLYGVDDAPPIDPTLLIQDPLRARRRGRPRGARNLPSTQNTQSSPDPLTQDSSIHRDPSSWEVSRGRVRGTGRGRGRGRGTGHGRGRGRGET